MNTRFTFGICCHNFANFSCPLVRRARAKVDEAFSRLGARGEGVGAENPDEPPGQESPPATKGEGAGKATAAKRTPPPVPPRKAAAAAAAAAVQSREGDTAEGKEKVRK